MVDKPAIGQSPWGEDLNSTLDFLEADATAKSEAARIAAQAALSAQIDASRDRSTHTGTQDVSTITGLDGAITSRLDETVLRTTGAQSKSGVLTLTDRPVVPDASFGVQKIAAAGTRDATTFLSGDGSFRVPEGSGSGSGANALGTLSNPVVTEDGLAARPTGLTRVVWDSPVDPVNRQPGDYNLRKGT